MKWKTTIIKKVDEMTEKLQKEVNIKIHSEVMFRFKWHII